MRWIYAVLILAGTALAANAVIAGHRAFAAGSWAVVAMVACGVAMVVVGAFRMLRTRRQKSS